MLKSFDRFTAKYVNVILDRIPGKARFGNYRILPFFFLIGASIEYLMVNWTVGPHKINFCNYFKKK
jgi:hypothetical protein